MNVETEMLKLIERLSWETHYRVTTQITGPEYAPEVAATLAPDYDLCRLCQAPRDYPHLPTCPVKALAALLGADVDNPDAIPELGPWEPRPAPSLIAQAPAAAFAPRRAASYAPLPEDDCPDPFATW